MAKDWASGKCDSTSRMAGLDGLSQAQLAALLGEPKRKETFRLGDRKGEFGITLQNHYPLSKAANAKVQLQEWTWETGKCKLTVWLHKPAADWASLENLRYPADAEF